MPGVKSLAVAQYYAHPRNSFWRLVESIFGINATLPYEERLRRLGAAGVGFWDVLKHCERRGSLDVDIVD